MAEIHVLHIRENMGGRRTVADVYDVADPFRITIELVIMQPLRDVTAATVAAAYRSYLASRAAQPEDPAAGLTGKRITVI